VGIFGKLQEVVFVYFARQACKSSRWELNVVIQIRCWLIIVWDKYYWSERPGVCRTDYKCKQICAGADLRRNWASMNESVRLAAAGTRA
jgi:hypothetical protein